MKEYMFFNTSLSNCIENAFQALALDEERAAFSPSVWEKTRGNSTVSLRAIPNIFEFFSTDQRRAELEASMVSGRPLEHWRWQLRRRRTGKYHFSMDDISDGTFPRFRPRVHP